MAYYSDYGGYGWRPYVSVAARRAKAAREMEKLRRQGHPVSPVTIEGRAIATTFWGKAWCDNLERYSDYANRIPRGRTYVRNGSVVDLQITAGRVDAKVSGSDIYEVTVQVSPVPKARWTSIRTDCAGGIDSLVELLQGRFAKGVMERICQQKVGLFPAPAEIEFSCSCPDWASMCKHVAAVLYGVGARLDEKPELLFKLRKVDEKELIAHAGKGLPLSRKAPASNKVLAEGGLSELFGLEMGVPGDEPNPRAKAAGTAGLAKSAARKTPIAVGKRSSAAKSKMVRKAAARKRKPSRR
jgi:uncharacterized Zn finger protein